MTILFEKFQGAGNDFIILEKNEIDKCLSAHLNTADLVRAICRPHYGVAADGLFIVQGREPEDNIWHIEFYNCDGTQASMCGNGARCVSSYLFARMQGITTLTLALGDLRIGSTLLPNGDISIQMPVNETFEWLPMQGGYLLNTGVPHLVMQCDTIEELQAIDLITAARPLRYEVCGTFGGVNVDYYCRNENEISIRTYERGVEGETRACGTGAVAVALVAASVFNLASPLIINAVGGKLSVSFQIMRSPEEEFIFKNVFLTGDAIRIARGEYYL